MRSGPSRWRRIAPAAAAAAAAALGALTLALGPGDARQAPPRCAGALELDLACHARRYARIVARSGAAAALDDLRRRRRASGFVRAGCHRLTHVIGRAAVTRHGGAAGALARNDPVCSAGYQHGVVEAVMADLGPVRAHDDARAICARFRARRPRSPEHYNCAHGLGHGFMRLLDDDLFAALDACDGLGGGWETRQCAGGVFMQNVFDFGDPRRPARALRPAEPLYPCPAVATRFRAECYDEQAAFALAMRGDDVARVFRLCAASAGARDRPACYRGVGSKAAIQGNKQVIGGRARAQATRRLCLLGPGPEARARCVEGAVKTILRDFEGHEQARRLCAAVAGSELAAPCAATERRWKAEVAR